MDKIVRDKLDAYVPEPPQRVWDNILIQLNDQRRKVRLLYYRRIAAAAVILLAFMGGWYLVDRSKNVVPEQAKLENTEQKPADIQDHTFVEKPGISTSESFKPALADQQVNAKAEPESYTKRSATEPKVNDFMSSINKEDRYVMNRMKALSIHWEKNMSDHNVLNKKQLPHAQDEADRLLIAQNIKTLDRPGDKEAGWVLGVQVTPGYSSQIADYGVNYSSQMTYSGSEGNGTFGGGFSVQVRTGKKWHVESGVYYARNGQKSMNSLDFNAVANQEFLSDEKAYFNTPVAVSLSNTVDRQMTMNSVAGVIEFSGTPVGTELVARIDQAERNETILLTSGEFSQVFDLLEIPLYLRYSLIDTKFGLDLLGGLNAGFVAGNNVFMKNSYGLQNVGKTQDISPVNFSGTLGVGFSWEVSSHLSLSMEPRINYYLNSINTHPEIDFRPYRVGVFTGLYYEF